VRGPQGPVRRRYNAAVRRAWSLANVADVEAQALCKRPVEEAYPVRIRHQVQVPREAERRGRPRLEFNSVWSEILARHRTLLVTSGERDHDHAALGYDARVVKAVGPRRLPYLGGSLEDVGEPVTPEPPECDQREQQQRRGARRAAEQAQHEPGRSPQQMQRTPDACASATTRGW